MKTCTKCGETRPREAFSKHAARSDGLQPHCKDCNRESSAKWYAANAERTAEYRRDYYRANAEQRREWQREYDRANPDKMAAKKARRRALKAGATHVPYSRAEIFARWNGTCCYCDAAAEHLDHVTPLSKQGADADWNLVPACEACNCSKGAKSLAEWALTFAPETVSVSA